MEAFNVQTSWGFFFSFDIKLQIKKKFKNPPQILQVVFFQINTLYLFFDIISIYHHF